MKAMFEISIKNAVDDEVEKINISVEVDNLASALHTSFLDSVKKSLEQWWLGSEVKYTILVR